MPWDIEPDLIDLRPLVDEALQRRRQSLEAGRDGRKRYDTQGDLATLYCGRARPALSSVDLMESTTRRLLYPWLALLLKQTMVAFEEHAEVLLVGL